MIETSIKKEFLNSFYHIIEDYQLENNNTLNVFSLKIQNNRFAYSDLVELLGNHLYYFALSRTEIKELEDTKQYQTLINRTKSKFKQKTKKSDNEGELGEVLLYCLLESHLNAPKILTKLALKTANNDYVKGADGVHLLELEEQNYQLILGESKLNSDLQKGIYEAFGSLLKLLKNGGNKIKFEQNLVNSQLVKETYNEEQYKILKSILLPKAEEIDIDYSFGIFLGFDFSITDKEMKMSNADFRETIKERVKSTVLSVVKSFNYQIRKEEFRGYSFYIYTIPFSDLENKRKEITKDLTK